MLKKFTGEKDLALTIRGCSGTSAFSFDFQGAGQVHRIAVDRAQIEVDAGFEGESVWLSGAAAFLSVASVADAHAQAGRAVVSYLHQQNLRPVPLPFRQRGELPFHHAGGETLVHV